MSIPRVVRDRWFNTSGCRTVEFGPSLTHQELRDECDINLIMRRYMTEGEMPRPSAHAPRLRYADYASGPDDFFAAQQVLLAARSSWESLPVVLQDRFRGDVEGLFRFVADARNRDELTRLGVLVPSAPGGGPGEDGHG